MSNKKNMDFEINLMPMISVLAVCISMLLLTSVWVSVGQITVEQGLGTESTEQSKIGSLMVQFRSDQKVHIKVEDSEVIRGKAKSSLFRLTGNQEDFTRIEAVVRNLIEKDDNIKQAVLLPDLKSPYKDMIQVMDKLKGLGIKNIGIAPVL